MRTLHNCLSVTEDSPYNYVLLRYIIIIQVMVQHPTDPGAEGRCTQSRSAALVRIKNMLSFRKPVHTDMARSLEMHMQDVHTSSQRAHSTLAVQLQLCKGTTRWMGDLPGLMRSKTNTIVVSGCNDDRMRLLRPAELGLLSPSLLASCAS